jgi:branched-chain amino acid transport system substrate-binding protein
MKRMFLCEKGLIPGLFFGFLVLLLSLSTPSWAKDILIGLDGPLSGPAASFGLDAINAVNMAIDEINAAGGIQGDKLKVIAKDSMQDPTKARTNAEELVHKDGVIAFFASTLTTNNLASLEVTTKGKVPHIIAGTTSDVVCPAEPGKCNPWVFRLPILNSWQAEKLAIYAVKDMGAKRVALMYDSTGYGLDGKKNLEANMQKLGAKIAISETFSMADVDFTPQLQRICDAQGDAIITWTLGVQVARIVQSMKRLGLSIPVLGSEAITEEGFRKLAGAAAEGVYIADRMPAAYDSKDPKVQAFVKKWRERTKMEEKLAVPSWSVTYYDAVYWLAEGLKKAGTDREKLREALENSSYTGVTGITYTFSPQKHNGRSGPDAVSVVQVKDGALVTPKK